MKVEGIERRIDSAIPEATAGVQRARGAHDDDHLSATVRSPAFEGESLVDRHQRVYDALDELMTTDIHALELTTETPTE